MSLHLWPLAKRIARSDRSPRWLAWLAERYMRRYVLRNVLMPLGSALEAGAGLHEADWQAGTSAETILKWFDETIAAQPAIGILDHNVMSILQGDAGVITQSLAMQLPLPEEIKILARWEGTRQGWWAEGRDVIAAGIPIDHDGLYTVTDSAGTAFQQTFRARR